MATLGSRPEPRLKKMLLPRTRVLVVNVELRSEVGCAADLIRIFSQHGVNVLSFIMWTGLKDERVYATLFLDLENREIPQEPLRELKYSSKVERIRLVSLPLTPREAALISLTVAEAKGLRRMAESLGSGGKAIMFHSGFEAGRDLAEKFKASYDSNRRALENFLLYSEVLGRGKFRLESYLDGAYCKVIVEGLVECVRVRSSEPNSQMFRGMLSGFISGLWGREVSAVETRCIAKGDPYCEFEIRV